ncbi:MAG: hypothetical protein JXA53_04460 [Bacteroidales bacterium]|nr:hypothetical protein [Bacteroidales bacterium]
MSIKYNIIEKGKPGVVGGGEKKFYANAVTSGELSLEDLIKGVEKISTVSGADISAVIYGLVDFMQASLADGKIVRLGKLGSLRVSISSNGEDSADKVTSRSIKGAKALFTPGKDLKFILNNLTYQKN